MITNTYAEFSMIQSAEAEAAYQQEVCSEGYAGFRRLLDGLTEAIKAAADADIPGLEQALAKLAAYFLSRYNSVRRGNAFGPSWRLP